MGKGRQLNRLDKNKAIAAYAADEVERGALEVGTVKFYDAVKKFGFVNPEDTSKPAVFLAGALVERSGIPILYAGDRLQYVRIRDRHGRSDTANHIRLLTEAAP